MIEGLFVGRMDVSLGKAVRFTTGILSLPISFYLVSKINIPHIITKIFSAIGKETLGIYVLHFVLLDNLGLVKCENIALLIMILSLISFVIIGICLMAIRILGTNKLIKQCLLGAK